MPRLILICIFCAALTNAKAQQSLKPDYFKSVPAAIKNCGALYTYDTTSLKKKQYIMLADFQNLGLIMIGGKQVRLTLGDTKLVNKTTNVATYKGGGYTVMLSTRTVKQTGSQDIEEGTLEISKGKDKLVINIHGRSGCDEAKQEGN